MNGPQSSASRHGLATRRVGGWGLRSVGGGWLQRGKGGWLGFGCLVYTTRARSLLALCLVSLFDTPSARLRSSPASSGSSGRGRTVVTVERNSIPYTVMVQRTVVRRPPEAATAVRPSPEDGPRTVVRRPPEDGRHPEDAGSLCRLRVVRPRPHSGPASSGWWTGGQTERVGRMKDRETWWTRVPVTDRETSPKRRPKCPLIPTQLGLRTPLPLAVLLSDYDRVLDREGEPPCEPQPRIEEKSLSI